MTSEHESLVLQILRDMRAEVADMRTQVGTKDDLAALRDELKSDMHSLRADVASDILTFRRELGERIVGLRREVIEYHTSVIGHGVLIGEPEARLRRIEQHLDLPATDTH